jgi:hypothetical protein
LKNIYELIANCVKSIKNYTSYRLRLPILSAGIYSGTYENKKMIYEESFKIIYDVFNTDDFKNFAVNIYNLDPVKINGKLPVDILKESMITPQDLSMTSSSYSVPYYTK